MGNRFDGTRKTAYTYRGLIFPRNSATEVDMFSIGICTDFTRLPDVAPLGYDYVEIPLEGLASLPEADFQEFADYVQGRGIRVAACSRLLPEDLPVTGPNVSATRLHGYLNHALRRAQRLGIRVAVLDAAKSRAVPRDEDYPFAWRQLGNFLRLIQGHARDCGVTVAIEPLRRSECDLMNSVGEAALIAGLLQLENVGVAAHTGSMAMVSETPASLRRAAPLLKHVHVENALTRALPAPNDGEDYRRLVKTLKDIGYNGGVSLCGTITDRFEEDARIALDWIRKEMLE